MADCIECLHYAVCADIAEKTIESFVRKKAVDKICKNFKEHKEYKKTKHSRWYIKNNLQSSELISSAVRICTECNSIVPILEYECEYRYCPHCGSRMDGEKR